MGVTGQLECYCAGTTISGFPQAGWRQVRQSFDDRACLGPCVILVRLMRVLRERATLRLYMPPPRGNLVDVLPRAPKFCVLFELRRH